MNIREAARKAGGEELVAQVIKAEETAKEVFDKVKAVVVEVLDGKDGDEEKVLLAACCEAMANVFGDVAAIYTIKALDNDRSAGILTAVKALSNSMNIAFEDIDAMDGDVMTKIKVAAKKGGK